ncbi:MAG TPA: DUF3606 domain-containing protein [Burkholderiales bacterium]|nr:DUF3606 domain-containing protein [Burkholderiales bacterium]
MSNDQRESAMNCDSTTENGMWERIDLEDRSEIRDWASSFAVSDEQLIEAVRVVGVRASTVREYLEKTKPAR